MDQDHPLSRLIEEIKKIPGVGAKTAQRMAFYIIGLSPAEADSLADSIREAKNRVFTCSVCNSLTHVDPCLYCRDENRRNDVLCIVEEPFNIEAIEKTGIFRGRYHVLLGAMSPLKGRGPDEMKSEKLLKRIQDGVFEEIIIATNPTSDGEATAAYLTRLLKDYHIKMTRLAMGLPVGSDLDYADQVTIKKSLEGRTEIKD